MKLLNVTTNICTNCYASKFSDEPSISSLGGYPDGIPETLKQRYFNIFKEGVSVIAVDTNKNDLICGVMLSSLINRYVSPNQLNMIRG